VATFGQVRRSQPKNIVPPATQTPKETGEPSGAIQVPPDPSPVHPGPSASRPVDDPSDLQTPVVLYPIDTWPFEETQIGADAAEGANCSGEQDACDPGGALVDHVNWFRHKMDILEGFTFDDTSLGVDVLEKPPDPVDETFYQRLATQFAAQVLRPTSESPVG
jgi:hypothetical protein